jgi:hypothetical protein
MLSYDTIFEIVSNSTSLPQIVEDEMLFSNGISPNLASYRDRVGKGGDFTDLENTYFKNQGILIAESIGLDNATERR